MLLGMVLVASVLALLVGVSLGIMGGGGSILTVPILRYVLRYEAHQAIAVSMLVVGATSLVALFPHARRGQVRWKVGVTFGSAGMLGAFLAGRSTPHIPGVVLLTGFVLMMWVTAYAMLREPKGAPASAGYSWSRLVVQGFAVGAATGLLGAGGGFVVVPALVLLAGLPITQAVGTSLVIVAMNAAAGFIGMSSSITLDRHVALIMVGAAMLGSVVGSLAGRHISPTALRKAFGWFVAGMGLFVLLQELPGN